MSELAVEMRDVWKAYPDGTIALRGVNFNVRKGEIHGLLGENGAGKTTLMRILYGEIRPSKGEIKVFGKKVSFKGPWDAVKNGIGMVYQHFSLIPSFTVLENLYLSLTSIKKGISIDYVKKLANEVMSKVGFEVPLDAKVEDLAVGVQQRIEILKTLMRDAKILILDEPTSVLTPIEVEELFKTLTRLKNLSITIIFISHKLKEVKRITDRVTVLRKGKVVGVVETREVDEANLAKMMVGREIFLRLKKTPISPKEPILVIEDLWVKDDRGLDAVRGISLTLKKGEILGIAGIQGNGQRELAEAIAGLRPVIRGRILLENVDITNLPPYLRYRKGLSYIPDSRSIGLILDLNVISNSILTKLRDFVGKGATILWSKAREFTGNLTRRFNVVVESLNTPVKYLSGGNQQKLMVGREVAVLPKVIIASEPTHGLDVSATEYIRSLLIRLREMGVAILLISSDLDEVLQLSDRIAVIYEGKIMAIGRPQDFTLEKLGLLMGGVKVE